MAKKRSKTKRQRDGLVKFAPEKLKRLQLRKGLSRRMLATQADVSRRTVVSAYQGKGIFPSSAKLIARALEVSVEELLPHKTDEDACSDRVYALPAT